MVGQKSCPLHEILTQLVITNNAFWNYSREHRRWKVHDYNLLLLSKSSIWFTGRHIFKIIIYFFNKSKCATNYVISFEVYNDFRGEKILKLWMQEIWPYNENMIVELFRAKNYNGMIPSKKELLNTIHLLLKMISSLLWYLLIAFH